MNVEQGFGRRRAGEGTDMPDEGAALAARRRGRMILGGVIGAVVLIVAYFLMHGGRKDSDPAPAAAPTVTYIVPGKQSVTNSVSATGNLAARVEMPVGISGEGGMVTRVLVQPGDWVAAGQTLATVDRAVQAEQTGQMAAQIQVAEADARLAQSNLERAEKLVGRGFISRADIEQKTATRDAAVARVKLARAQYGEMRARMGRLDIRSPAAGLVLTRQIEPGQIVSSGGSTLFTIAKDGEMELKARLAEQDLAQMKVGFAARVTPVGLTQSFPGRIWQISPVIDAVTRQGIARIALHYDPAIRPGGFAMAEISSGAVDAPQLPESAVLSDEKGNFVYLIGADDKVRRQPVKIGAVSDTGIAILSGLSGNEHVVLSAGAFLNPGDKVTPERAKTAR